MQDFFWFNSVWATLTKVNVACNAGSFVHSFRQLKPELRKEQINKKTEYPSPVNGIPSRPHKLKVVINPRSKKGQARLVYLKQVAPLFEKAGITADLLRLFVLEEMVLYMKLLMDY